MNTTIAVPSGGAWFDGHFPGRAILPGVGELALALEALAVDAGAVSIKGIAHARLRQLVFPGDRLDLAVREAKPEHLRIDLKRGGAPVANAEFILGMPEPPREPAIPPPGNPWPRDFPPLDNLMPHRPPMRFLASIRMASDSGLDGTALIPGACALAGGGSASPLAALEAAAQAAAAWETLRRLRDNPRASPRIGYLVALREVFFFAERAPADREFSVRIELEAAALPLTHYRIEASLGEKLIASGTIATYLTDDYE